MTSAYFRCGVFLASASDIIYSDEGDPLCVKNSSAKDIAAMGHNVTAIRGAAMTALLIAGVGLLLGLGRLGGPLLRLAMHN